MTCVLESEKGKDAAAAHVTEEVPYLMTLSQPLCWQLGAKREVRTQNNMNLERGSVSETKSLQAKSSQDSPGHGG